MRRGRVAQAGGRKRRNLPQPSATIQHQRDGAPATGDLPDPDVLADSDAWTANGMLVPVRCPAPDPGPTSIVSLSGSAIECERLTMRARRILPSIQFFFGF